MRALLIAGILLQAAPALAALHTVRLADGHELRFRARGFSTEEESRIGDGFLRAYLKALYCPSFARRAPEVRTRVLDRFYNAVVSIERTSSDPEAPGECAFTDGTVIFGHLFRGRIHLRPAAFSQGCFGLGNVLFHEMIHYSWISGEEDPVESLELGCLGR